VITAFVFFFQGIESEALLIVLDKGGICASFGSFYLADS
jgi:cysteine sulfinate desulfinase/cysteine desulfurase-like protein